MKQLSDDRAIAEVILNRATVIQLNVEQKDPLCATVIIDRPDDSILYYHGLTDTDEIESIMECHAREAQAEGLAAAITTDGRHYSVLA